MASTIAFDIEVAGFDWDEVDSSTREYLLKKAKTDEARAEVPERLALYPGLGKIITIGMWNVEQERGLVLLEGEHEEQQPWEAVANTDIYRGSEAQLLERFWEIVERKKPRLVSYNGRGYDGPILNIRSAQLGIAPTLNLVGNRYRLGSHVDLLEIFTFLGAYRDRYSLDYWCHRFGVDSPKDGIDGSQVGEVYRNGGIEEIGAYCVRDVKATAELYQKLEHTLLPLFS